VVGVLVNRSRRDLAARLTEERGGVLVLFGLLMPFFLLLGALALDIGNWYVHKRHLQTQVDAAALAGGALFGECFADPAAGNSAIYDEATKYGGAPGSLYNEQVGGDSKGTITLLYQSKTFARGGPGPDDTETQGPCETPSLMFDVKGTEADLPLIFNIPGLPSVDAINARARVQLKTAKIAKGSLPLAVPEVNPRHVTATFVNESGAPVAGPVELAGPTASGRLNAWTGSASVTIPAGQRVGVRIGVGQASGTCGSSGTHFVCYDYSSPRTGLVTIAGFDRGGTPTEPGRQAFEVWPVTACSGSPFFSDAHLIGGATTCAAGIQVVVHPETGAIDPAKVLTFTATVNGQTRPLTHDGGVWSTGYAFDLSADEGPFSVSLTWRYQGGSRKSYDDVQQLYSATDDSGPLKVVTLTGGSGSGAPYALKAGTHSITVNVALEGALHLSAPDEMVLLRLTGGSRTTAVACDGSGASEFREAIINGCTTPYQINPVGYCPDPAPPPGPADCVPLKTGTMAGPTLQGLDTRFASCPPYNWPAYETDDPRIVRLLITDFSALDGSGRTDVPVTNFAAFYVAGWTGSRCANPPPPFAVKKGSIWGFFIKYAAPDPEGAGTETCDPRALTPCIPVLTR
jgi:hypothetical protein